MSPTGLALAFLGGLGGPWRAVRPGACVAVSEPASAGAVPALSGMTVWLRVRTGLCVRRAMSAGFSDVAVVCAVVSSERAQARAEQEDVSVCLFAEIAITGCRSE